MMTIAVTSDGAFCVAGGISGKIFAWDVASGTLLRVWRGHWKSVSALLFWGTDSCLISGGEDAAVHVWSLNE
jgi:pre-rRNA-processing protein IPI3